MAGQNLILRGRVQEWLIAAKYVDNHLDSFIRPEARACYNDVRHIFEPGAKLLSNEKLQEMQYELSEEASFYTDEFGTALKLFAGKISLIIKDREAFRAELETVLNDDPQRRRNEPPKVVKEIHVINGDRWEGLFLEGSPVKEGVIHYADGRSYRGPWCADGPDGRGMLTGTGTHPWTVEADFSRGVLTGSKSVTYKWQSGDSFTTTLEQPQDIFSPQINGKGTYRFASGESESGVFKNGKWSTFEYAPQQKVIKQNFTGAQKAIIFVSMAMALLSVIAVSVIS